MKQFRKKPVVIEAVQYRESMRGTDQFPEGVFICPWREHPFTGEAGDYPTIHTREGDVIVQDGDWIIKGVKGEFYPCKPDIFEATYEEVGPSPAPQPASAGLSFSLALYAIKAGKRVAREGWNGKAQWVALSGTELRPARVPTEGLWSPHSRAEADRQGGSVEVLPAVILRNAQGQIVMGWVPSTGDLLADDWAVLPD